MTNPENGPVLLGRQELEVKYPGLQPIVERVSRTTVQRFRKFRPEVYRLRPPFLLIPGEQLLSETARTLKDSVQEGSIESHAVISYEPTIGCILASREYIAGRLSQGASGCNILAEQIAEEYTHAFSTFPDGPTSVRTGFAHAPFPYIGNQFEQGRLYETLIEHGSPNEKVWQEDPVEIRLTENTTRLVVNLLQQDLMREIGDQYPYVFIYRPVVVPDSTQFKHVAVRKGPAILDAAIGSLVSGRKQDLYNFQQGDIYRSLASLGVRVKSVKKVPPHQSDFFNYQ